MTYQEVKKDLFDVPNHYYLAHCINGSYTLGAGIAKAFAKKMGMRDHLISAYPIINGDPAVYIGKALLIKHVFNLVTKAHHYDKPTYESLYFALKNMHDQCKDLGIKHLAMPKIGCGFDRLDWGKVSEMIREVFSDLNIDILVCYL